MPLALPALPLRTARLILRPLEERDFGTYAAYHGRRDVYRFLYSFPPEAQALRQQFDRACQPDLSQDGATTTLAVERSEDGVVLGEVLLKAASTAALQGELGYIFDPAHAGGGYATEAAAEMLRAGFEEIGFHRIFARIDADNHGSVKVAERLGLRREAHFRQNDRHDGRWGDEFVYALLAEEWSQRG
ncbi:GNAT family N-acetyltransferase [Stappia indica]|uniref:GNAT family N-acetyltransferase n=1 Tax=Stappia indica TaxID=538381 RepID=UPI00082B5000|nr:GNAT family protein [Stappia indica]